MAETVLTTNGRPFNGHAVHEPQAFAVPARHNPRLQALVERLNADEELRQLWRCAKHAVSASAPDASCLTLEASVLTLADALDMTKGRVRLSPANGGPTGAADEVLIQRHRRPPVRVVIGLSRADSAGPVETLLRSQVRHALLAGWVEVAARVGDASQDLLLPRRAVPPAAWRCRGTIST